MSLRGDRRPTWQSRIMWKYEDRDCHVAWRCLVPRDDKGVAYENGQKKSWRFGRGFGYSLFKVPKIKLLNVMSCVNGVSLISWLKIIKG